MDSKEILFTPEEYFISLSSSILAFVSEFNSRIIIKIIDNKDYVDEPKRFFYTIVNKTISSLEAANILIRNFDSNKNLQTPLNIIVRSILSDIIVAEFIINCAKTEDEKKIFIERMYFDHISNLIDSMPTAAKVYKWTDEELYKNIDSLKTDKRFFSESGDELIKPLPSSPRSLIKRIFCESRSDTNLKLHRRAFDLYETYSKFEHLGNFSFNLTHRNYDNKEQLNLTIDVYDAVRISVCALNNYIHMWEDTLKNEFEILKTIETEIVSTHPTKIKYN